VLMQSFVFNPLRAGVHLAAEPIVVTFISATGEPQRMHGALYNGMNAGYSATRPECDIATWP
jgi:hypothetical protein